MSLDITPLKIQGSDTLKSTIIGGSGKGDKGDGTNVPKTINEIIAKAGTGGGGGGGIEKIESSDKSISVKESSEESTVDITVNSAVHPSLNDVYWIGRDESIHGPCVNPLVGDPTWLWGWYAANIETKNEIIMSYVTLLTNTMPTYNGGLGWYYGYADEDHYNIAVTSGIYGSEYALYAGVWPQSSDTVEIDINDVKKRIFVGNIISNADEELQMENYDIYIPEKKLIEIKQNSNLKIKDLGWTFLVNNFEKDKNGHTIHIKKDISDMMIEDLNTEKKGLFYANIKCLSPANTIMYHKLPYIVY